MAVPLVILFVVLGLLVIWLMLRNPLRGIIWLVVLLVIPLGVTQYIYFNRRHCPKCRNLLAARHEYYPGTRRYRIFLDCSHCHITWDTGCDGSDTRYS